MWDFFHMPSEQTAGGTKRKRKVAMGPATLVRKSAADYFVALDHVLHHMYGKSLATFCPPQAPTALPLAQRDTLVMWQDEGSPGFALA
eukprot:10107894-Lingulodinium_polyedra.AAC.1